MTQVEALAALAESADDPAARLAPLDSARTLLYQAMSFSGTSRMAAALADGAGPLTATEIDRALRRARMDVCRAAPTYRCLVDNALEAARATVPEGRDLAFRSISLAQARLGDVDGAIETAARIPGFDPTAGRSRDGGEAYAYYPRFDDPRVVIVAMTARGGDPATALERAERLGVVPRAWREIEAAFARRGDTLQAVEVVARALELANGIEDGEERTRLLIHAVSAWRRLGRGDFALDVLTRALAAADSVVPPESRISLLADLATASADVSAAHAEQAAGEALSLLDDAGLRSWVRVQRLRDQLHAVVGSEAGGPPRRGPSFMRQVDALAAARAGDIDSALAYVDRYPDRFDRGRIKVLTEVAAARIRGGDIQAARRDLDRIEAGIAANRERLAQGVDHSWHYHAAGTLANVAAVLAQAGDSTGARDMYMEGVAEAAKVGPWDVYPFRDASPDGPNPFDTFGSGAREIAGGSNPLAEDYVYISGLALHAAACTAAAAGFPVDSATLQEAVFPTGRPGTAGRYDVRHWIGKAVALSLSERSCRAEDGAIPPREWTVR